MQDSEVTIRSRLSQSITKEEVEPKLIRIGMSERDIRYLFTKTNFLTLQCRNHQLHFFNDFYFETYNKRCTTNELALVFDMNPKTVRKNLKNLPQEIKEPGRHRALGDEIEQNIIHEIESRFQNNKPMTQKSIIDYIQNNFNISVTFGWINSFLCRHKLQKCRSYPQEDLRLTIPRIYLEKHIENLKEFVQGTCSELLFNCDEVGLSAWEDRKILKVVLPKDVNKNNVYHSISRKMQHVTMLVCVSAAGDALTPMIITKN